MFLDAGRFKALRIQNMSMTNNIRTQHSKIKLTCASLSVRNNPPTKVHLLKFDNDYYKSVLINYLSTSSSDDDITHWQSQVFAPADEVLTTSRLEFRLTGLTPGTLYRLRGKLYLHNLPLEPESEVYTIRTHDVPVVSILCCTNKA